MHGKDIGHKIVSLGIYCSVDGIFLNFTSPNGNTVRVDGRRLDQDIVKRCNDAIWNYTPVTVTVNEMWYLASKHQSVEEAPSPSATFDPLLVRECPNGHRVAFRESLQAYMCPMDHLVFQHATATWI